MAPRLNLRFWFSLILRAQTGKIKEGKKITSRSSEHAEPPDCCSALTLLGKIEVLGEASSDLLNTDVSPGLLLAD